MSRGLVWTEEQLAEHSRKQDRLRQGIASLPKTQPLSKHRNKKCEIDGLTFDSLKESRRYIELKNMQQAGHIRDLRMQEPYSLNVNGHHVCDYRADFSYIDHGQTVVEDVKGRKQRDPVYILKRKLMLAIYGIEILET